MKARHAGARPEAVWAVRAIEAAALLAVGCSAAASGALPPTIAARAACPVTQPVPPQTIPPDAARPIVSGYQGPPGGLRLSMYGNDALWVVLPPDGAVRGIPQGDGGVFEKFPTVRLLEGRLTAQARRLDGLASPAMFAISDGYGATGFQAVGVTFPTEGCWEITEQLGDHELRFVVRVGSPGGKGVGGTHRDAPRVLRRQLSMYPSIAFGTIAFGSRTAGGRPMMSGEALQRIAERARQDAAFQQQLQVAPLAALSGYALSDAERLQVVLPNFSWLLEGELAGAARPRTDDALALLQQVGVRAVLSLSEAALPSERLAAYHLEAEHLPIADFTAPTLPQVARAVATIERFRATGNPVVVHCGAGLGRTGTILACYLVHQGHAAAAAVAAVRARRPGSIETAEQEAVVTRYEAQVRQFSG